MNTILSRSAKVAGSFLIMLGAVSCSDSFFDKYPTDQPIENTFFTDELSVKQVLNDAYFALRAVYTNYYVFGDLAADNVYNSKFNNSANHITINESNVVADNGIISSFWDASYAVISRTNLVLDNIEKIPMSDEAKAQYTNEARFLRALMYFNLVRIYGGVPLVLTDIKTPEEAFSHERATVDAVYEQVISDLNAAEALPAAYTNNQDIGRATRWAAKGLLAKVYLTLKQYNDANTKLLEVIGAPVGAGANSFHLLDNYEDIFDAANPNNAEVIFAIQYARGFSPSQGNPFVNGAMANEDIGSGVLVRGTGTFLMTTDLFNQFSSDDSRNSMIKQLTGSRRKYTFTLKYYDKGMTSTIDAGNDWIVLRYADINLMYAEVQNELGHPDVALPYLKAIRDRTGLTTDAALGTDAVAMRLAIEKERRMELFCEGHRWFDLSRTDRLLTVMNQHFKMVLPETDIEEIGSNSNQIDEYELIFPIPLFQVNLNPGKIIQNPNY